MAQLIQHRRGTAAEWTAANPVLAAGELGLELDTGRFKFGNGSTTWTGLAYAGGGGTSTVIDEETVQDIAAGLLAHTGHTNLTARYDDPLGRIILSSQAGSTVAGDVVLRRRCITGVWESLGTVTADQTILWIKQAITDPEPPQARPTDIVIDYA